MLLLQRMPFTITSERICLLKRFGRNTLEQSTWFNRRHFTQLICSGESHADQTVIDPEHNSRILTAMALSPVDCAKTMEAINADVYGTPSIGGMLWTTTFFSTITKLLWLIQETEMMHNCDDLWKYYFLSVSRVSSLLENVTEVSIRGTDDDV